MSLRTRFPRTAPASLALALLFAAGCGDSQPTQGPGLPYTPVPLAPTDLPRVLMRTSQGDIEVELFEDEAPNTVANFIELTEKKFYDGLTFHRIIRDFCVQGGDPKGDGNGGPGYRFKDEIKTNRHKNTFGTLAMANSGPDTNGSQFFFNVKAGSRGNSSLDGKHTVFGRVVKGLDVLEKLASVDAYQEPPPMQGRPKVPQKTTSVTVLSKRNHPYEVRDKLPEKLSEGSIPGLPPNFTIEPVGNGPAGGGPPAIITTDKEGRTTIRGAGNAPFRIVPRGNVPGLPRP